jgi:hypothetical protein
VADAFLDKFIADLVKGAEANSRANGGPGVNVIVARNNFGHEEKLASAAGGALEQRYVDGAKAAAARLGIKEAFLPALLPLAGSLLGGTALRAGVGALARGGAGKALGGIAGKLAPKMTGGIGGAATDMIGSMAGGAAGQRLAPQQPQQPQGAVPPL